MAAREETPGLLAAAATGCFVRERVRRSFVPHLARPEPALRVRAHTDASSSRAVLRKGAHVLRREHGQP